MKREVPKSTPLDNLTHLLAYGLLGLYVAWSVGTMLHQADEVKAWKERAVVPCEVWP